jgi:hypothetical protein
MKEEIPGTIERIRLIMGSKESIGHPKVST